MKKQLVLSVLIFTVVAAGIMTSGCPAGGGCHYREYEGLVTVADIDRRSGEDGAAGTGDEKIFVSLTFKAEGEAPAPAAAFSEDMQLTHAEVEQKGIKIGRQFRTRARYIDSGSCNPGPYLDKVDNWR